MTGWGSLIDAGTSTTRRSCVPTPSVRSPSRTSTSKRSLRPSAISRSVARTVQRAPSMAAPTCLMQTSKPTVACPSGSLGNASIAALRSIIPIIPGVESTLRPIVPPTSVTRRPSTVNSSTRSSPTCSSPRASSAIGQNRSYRIRGRR